MMAQLKDKPKNYITPSGLKKLKDELNHLLYKERPEITKTIAWAAANGDRSENADYIYGKKRLREIDRRIRFLKDRLGSAVEIDPLMIKSISIQFGATVELSDDEGNSKWISIVGIDEINLEKGHISWKSPIGSALIGKEEGDAVIVRTPKGEIEFEIMTIMYKDIHEN